ncbi:MAG: 50S ribosomal protein L10 [Candidatus Gribaldobacteria bacterium]|nr:50S ribosomal protein L10 [Candidatus Gribaldobacteria bacterium]
MAKTKEQKKIIITDLGQQMKEQKSVVMVDFSGVDSKSFFKLRDDLKDQGCSLRVVKKTLVTKMLESTKQPALAQKIEEFKGQMALAFGIADEVAPAKLCWNFGKTNKKFKILGAMLGNDFYSNTQVTALAQLPSKQQLLGQLVGTLQAPISGLVNVLQGNLRGLVNVVDAISKK